MFCNFDINKFVLQLLPPLLRKKNLYELIKIAVYPLNAIYIKFKLYKDLTYRKVSIKPQVAFVENLLNTTYYLPKGTIYITDITEGDKVYLHKKDENDTLYIYTSNEFHNDIIYIRKEDEVILTGKYCIHIPSFLKDNLAEISNLIEAYRPAGKKAELKIYTYE